MLEHPVRSYGEPPVLVPHVTGFREPQILNLSIKVASLTQLSLSAGGSLLTLWDFAGKGT